MEWSTGSMEVQVRAPVVRVPVLSKAMVVHLTRASSTLPPWIKMPLRHNSPTVVSDISQLLGGVTAQLADCQQNRMTAVQNLQQLYSKRV